MADFYSQNASKRLPLGTLFASQNLTKKQLEKRRKKRAKKSSNINLSEQGTGSATTFLKLDMLWNCCSVFLLVSLCLFLFIFASLCLSSLPLAAFGTFFASKKKPQTSERSNCPNTTPRPPQIRPRRAQNHPKTSPRPPKIAPRPAQDRPQTLPRAPQERSKTGLGNRHLFHKFRLRFGSQFGANMAPFEEPKWHQNRPKIDPKTKSKIKSQQVASWSRLGAILGRFWVVLAPILRAKIIKKHWKT